MAVCSTRYTASVITLHSEVTLTITFHYCMQEPEAMVWQDTETSKTQVHGVLELILSSRKMSKLYLFLS